ncbi:MAG: hypothetical protein KAV87_37120 [Desulfobacteraceae bacterium]|nr:hypothetical protein [Desulfobacteraceae bacterium]
MRAVIVFVIVLVFLAMSVHAESRGTGPFVAKVCKAEDGNFYLLDGFRVYSLQGPDQKTVAPFLGKFIRFECDPSQMGWPYTGLKKIREISYKDKNKDLQIDINIPKRTSKYGEPICFTINLYTKHEGGYSIDTGNMIAAIWAGGKGVPHVVRSFPINRVWGEGFDRPRRITAHSHKHSSYKRSVNVILEPGDYRLVIQRRSKQYDRLTKKWYELDILIAKPVSFSVVCDGDVEAVKARLYCWLNSGPVEERARAARKLVSLREGGAVYKKILDDLDTGVFDAGGRAQAILFVSRNPSSETVRVLRILILRQKSDIGIENVLSCISTDNRPDKRPKVLTEMLLNLLEEKRFVEAQHSSMSHVRVCDCVAAWLAATTNGSGYFAGKSIEERDKMISDIAKQAIPQDKPGDRWIQKSQSKGLPALQKKAYQQLARVHLCKFTQFDHRGSFDILSWRKDSNEPMDLLYKMGVNVLPVLAGALSDQTPTRTITTNRWEEKRVWKVNELIAVLIRRIADRDFAIGEYPNDRRIVDIRHFSELAPGFATFVLKWYQENKDKTWEERKIADLESDVPPNRLGAIKWLGKHKVHGAIDHLIFHIDNILSGEVVSSSTHWEISAAAFALGQIGDSKGFEAVKRACDHLSYWIYMSYRPIEQGRSAKTSGQIYRLFRAYQGMALLGHKEQALGELNRLFQKYGKEMENGTRKEYKEWLQRASKW